MQLNVRLIRDCIPNYLHNILSKAALTEDNYSPAGDLVNFPSVPNSCSAHLNSQMLHQRPTVESKVLCCWQCYKHTLFSGQSKITCSWETGGCSFTAVGLLALLYLSAPLLWIGLLWTLELGSAIQGFSTIHRSVFKLMPYSSCIGVGIFMPQMHSLFICCDNLSCYNTTSIWFECLL